LIQLRLDRSSQCSEHSGDFILKTCLLLFKNHSAFGDFILTSRLIESPSSECCHTKSEWPPPRQTRAQELDPCNVSGDRFSCATSSNYQAQHRRYEMPFKSEHREPARSPLRYLMFACRFEKGAKGLQNSIRSSPTKVLN
jgi:hypothetical protein